MGRISDILKQNMKIELQDHKKRLTEQEKEYWNKVNKHEDLKPIELNKDQIEKRFKTLCNSNLMNREYIIDQHNKKLIEFFILYFAEDQSFNKVFEKHSLNKGILLIGKCGTGKTATFRIFKEIVKHSRKNAFSIISSNKVVKEYELNTSSFDKYASRKFCFDDFGTENISKYYGKTEEIFKTLLEERYINFIEKDLKPYLTTNLSIEQIKQRYGERLHSRIFEMFNIILLDGNDRRKI
jgi:DNA replication protein DnaC